MIFAAGLGVLLLLGLNGNAGKWKASPNGQRLSAPSAPAADVMHEDTEMTKAPKVAKKVQKAKPKTKVKPKPKTTASAKPKPKSTSVSKPKSTSSKTASKTTTSKTAVPKKRGRPKGSKNKPKTGDA